MNNLKVKMKEKMNNKGFSLVELIIVIAIMAVLIAVLAPQFLRYVERSRIARDNTSIGEIATSIKVAMAEEDINTAVAALAAQPSYTATGGDFTFTALANGGLDDEIITSVGATVNMTSNTYNTVPPTINVTVGTDGTVTVECEDYMTAPDSAINTTQRL